jgi:hypothetical protein
MLADASQGAARRSGLGPLGAITLLKIGASAAKTQRPTHASPSLRQQCVEPMLFEGLAVMSWHHGGSMIPL